MLSTQIYFEKKQKRMVVVVVVVINIIQHNFSCVNIIQKK